MLTVLFCGDQMDQCPQELLDCIIDHLHADIQALDACSTVCRAWSTPARYHLLEGILLYLPEEFEVVLNSSIPFSCIRRITTRGYNKITPKILELPWSTRFENITHLKLEDMEANTPEIDLLVQPFFQNFPSIHTLSLSMCKFLSLSTVMRFILSLLKLTNLEMDFTKWDFEGDILALDCPRGPFPVRHLRVVYPSDPLGFIDCLLNLHPILHLWSFWIVEDEDADEELTLRVLASCRASLRTVNLLGLSQYLVHTISLGLLIKL